jgi:hypothetical protein
MKPFALLIVGLAFAISPIAAQWLDYPTPNVPRTPDGKPNLSAPTPRIADGKPDLSGLWEPELNGRIGEGSIAIAPGDDPVTPEFINIGSRLKEACPINPGPCSWPESGPGRSTAQMTLSAMAFQLALCACTPTPRPGK